MKENMNGKFKVRNIHNLTAEQVKDKPVSFRTYGGDVPLGSITSADEDYLYGEFEHSSNDDVFIEFFPNKETIFSMEIRGDE